jgi:putative SOS response-associated peptidase YedK
MCGRYYQTESAEVIKEVFGIKTPSSELPQFSPRYNMAPMQMAPVIRLNSITHEKELIMMRWGLIPSWSKDNKSASFCINAKSESVSSKASFRSAFKSRRCLVPASGFFEWKKLNPKEKQPYKIAIKGEKVFGFAGLWESWVNPETNSPEETFTIITCEPNELVSELHDRMPVIVPKEHWDLWLSNENIDANLLQSLLRPHSDEKMYALPVSKAVGNVRNDSKDLLDEINEGLF